jgi:hypothetical protein
VMPRLFRSFSLAPQVDEPVPGEGALQATIKIFLVGSGFDKGIIGRTEVFQYNGIVPLDTAS